MLRAAFLTQLETEFTALVTALAVGKICSAKRARVVMAGRAARSAGREMHRSRRCTHRPASNGVAIRTIQPSAGPMLGMLEIHNEGTRPIAILRRPARLVTSITRAYVASADLGIWLVTLKTCNVAV